MSARMNIVVQRCETDQEATEHQTRLSLPESAMDLSAVVRHDWPDKSRQGVGIKTTWSIRFREGEPCCQAGGECLVLRLLR
jgi:hypothetical protein